MAPRIDPVIAKVVRDDWGRLLAALVTSLGDFQLAEDSLQDAVLAAMTAWARGMPAAPDAWLITTARRKAIDRIRRDQAFARKSAQIAVFMEQQMGDPDPQDAAMDIPDKRLEMLFTCCHPALDTKSQTALTLRTLGGLTAPQIARAFLDKPATMAQRLSRARMKIRAASIPYRVPALADLPDRTGSVMRVIYLIFNEGYAATSGEDAQRVDLMAEAIRLGRTLTELMPDDPEAAGLLALMLLHDARKAARTSDDGAMIALEFQDRSLWRSDQIAAASAMVQGAMRQGRVGPYQLQAAIAALHATSARWADTDWHQIAALYGVLETVSPNAVVTLNRAVAVSYAGQLPQALAMLDGIKARLDDYPHYHAAKADMLARAGHLIAASDCFQSAINLTENRAERGFLQAKRAALRVN